MCILQGLSTIRTNLRNLQIGRPHLILGWVTLLHLRNDISSRIDDDLFPFMKTHLIEFTKRPKGHIGHHSLIHITWFHFNHGDGISGSAHTDISTNDMGICLGSIDLECHRVFHDIIGIHIRNHRIEDYTIGSKSGGVVTITNYKYAGEPVTYTYEKAPEKVIAVYQGCIETMIALGLEDHVLASYGLDNEVKDEWKDGFAQMNYDETVFAPDKETVTLLEPDMIFSWGSYFGEKKLGDAVPVIDWTH